MHHLDLVLDDASDRAVRDEWAGLVAADLPSQARHRSASNRPHVTLTTSEGWPAGGALEAALASLDALPLDVSLGPPVLFGRGPYVLARLVVATADLLSLHARVAEALAPLSSDLVRPGRWLPHVTLARRLTAERVEEALAVLGSEPGEVRIVGARHWDSVARLDESLVGP
ncbi:2'-5' RNA ligase family protein [Phycicoccus avicenniae]|uniref:2'-5' RNA ligase family protein n=1 Tax=Phycicoccus avicenniae TaxID=2828860 RepID=UPI003D275CE6